MRPKSVAGRNLKRQKGMTPLKRPESERAPGERAGARRASGRERGRGLTQVERFGAAPAPPSQPDQRKTSTASTGPVGGRSWYGV